MAPQNGGGGATPQQNPPPPPREKTVRGGGGSGRFWGGIAALSARGALIKWNGGKSTAVG